MFNSSPQADRISILLQHCRVISIEQKRAIRRANVARLLDEYGQTELADRTGITPAFLYQLGRGKGRAKRNVSDDRARGIERTVGLAPGWMDVDHSAAEETQSPQISVAAAPASRWPFRLAYERFARLTRDQRTRVEEVVEGMVLRFEASNQDLPTKREARPRHRRPAG